MKNTSYKKLFIVAGAAGEIGTAFCKKLAEKKIPVIAIMRNTPLTIESEYIHTVKCDISNAEEITRAFKKINLALYDEVTFFHTIGVDKYDPRGYPAIQKMETIDASVYDSNVNTFKYLFRYLLQEIRSINTSSGKRVLFKVGLLGGVSDKFAPVVIESFCEAKNICRQYMRSAVELHPDFVSALAINVSSTITKSALKVRPHADTAYWLTPEEVVEESADVLITHRSGYREIEIFKHSPQFRNGYYQDNTALYTKWSRETGIQ